MTTTDLAKRLGALATAHREALSALATDADDKAARLYRSLAADLDDKTFERLHDDVTALVQAVREDARDLAGEHFAAELEAVIGKNDIELETSKSPKPTDVGRFVDNAVYTARVMVSQAADAGGDKVEAFVRAAYHAQAIIDSESTVAYKRARDALNNSLASIPEEEAEALGFTVATEQSELRAVENIDTRADGDWIAVVGERWDARSDACPRCASVHGQIRPFGFPFSEPGPTVHARCQCIRTIWAVAIPWDSDKRASKMKKNTPQPQSDVAYLFSPIAVRAMGEEEPEENGPLVIRGCIASTESVDSHGSVIKSKGWDLRRYESNPLLLWNHALSSWNKDAEPCDILGRADAKVKSKQLVCDLYFDGEDINEKAAQVYRQCKAGTIRMLSVGFRPRKYHYEAQGEGQNDLLVIDEAELIEISVVPAGSNPDAFLPRDLRAMCPPPPPVAPAPPPPVEERSEPTPPAAAEPCPACTNASTPQPMERSIMDKAILEALGLSAEAPETEALASATRMREQIAAFVSLTGADSNDAAMGVIRAWQASAARVPELEAAVEATRAAEAKRERDSVIERAVSDMKLTPAEVDGWVKEASIETLRAFLATAPARAKSEPTPQAAPADGIELTAEDRTLMAKLGIDEKTYSEHKRSLAK